MADTILNTNVYNNTDNKKALRNFLDGGGLKLSHHKENLKTVLSFHSKHNRLPCRTRKENGREELVLAQKNYAYKDIAAKLNKYTPLEKEADVEAYSKTVKPREPEVEDLESQDWEVKLSAQLAHSIYTVDKYVKEHKRLPHRVNKPVTVEDYVQHDAAEQYYFLRDLHKLLQSDKYSEILKTRSYNKRKEGIAEGANDDSSSVTQVTHRH